MSRKEVLAVIRGGYRTYLMNSGFEKPILGDDIVFRNSMFPRRAIRIFTTPMFRAQVNYQIHLPELDDYQGIFKFRPDEDFYSWDANGWLEYRDETDLVNGFDYARQIHETWLNTLLNSEDITSFVERINGIRRSRVAAYAQLSQLEKNVAHEDSLKAGVLQSEFVRDFPASGWGKELLNRLCVEGKTKKRISEYWIEGSEIRGPKCDGSSQIIQTRIFVDGIATSYYFFDGKFFDERHRTVRYFVVDNRIWGPPGDPPWIVEYESATKI